MTPVERGKPCLVKAFTRRQDGGVNYADAEVGVFVEQLGDPVPVGWLYRLGDQLTRPERLGERPLSVDSDAVTKEVSDLGDDERRHDERPAGVCQQLHASRVISIAGGRGGDQRPGIDDQHSVALKGSRMNDATDVFVHVLGCVWRAACADRKER
jgi:hypothetical protein